VEKDAAIYVRHIHRVVDGSQAAEFVRAVQLQLEAPAGLLR